MTYTITFDYNNTLLNDLLPVFLTAKKIFEHYNQTPPTLKQFRNEFNLPYFEYWNKKIRHAKEQDLQTLFQKHYIEAIKNGPEVILFEGVQQTLNLLSKETKNNLIMVSSRSNVPLNQEITMHNIKKYFSEIHGSIHDKEGFLKKLIKEKKLDPKKTAYMGDTKYDMVSAKKAGILAVAFTEGINTKKKSFNRKPGCIF